MGADPEMVRNLDASAVVIHLEPGDFLVWDGRTIHCNVGPLLDEQRAEIARAGALITMSPRLSSSQAVLDARAKAWALVR